MDRLPPIRLQGTPIEPPKLGFEKFTFLASKSLFFAAAAPTGGHKVFPSKGTLWTG
jgi:hypothetical protein